MFTDMRPEELKQAIQRTDTRKSAAELMTPKKPRRVVEGVQRMLRKARDRFKQLQTNFGGAMRGHEREKEREHAGHTR